MQEIRGWNRPVAIVEFVIQVNLEHGTIAIWNFFRFWSIST